MEDMIYLMTFFHQMRYFEAFGVTKTLNISNLKIQYFQKKFLSVRNCSKKKKKRKSQWLNQELNPGSHDWTESVQTTISYRNVIVFFCEKHLIYIKNHQMDMNFKVDSNQDFFTLNYNNSVWSSGQNTLLPIMGPGFYTWYNY